MTKERKHIVFLSTTMFNKNYSNFVRPTSCEINSSQTTSTIRRVPLSGEEAKELYLNEIKQISVRQVVTKRDKSIKELNHQRRRKTLEISDRDLFLSVQNDDVDTLKLALDACPDNVNKLDDYGWSLLMIACQASSIESAKELLSRGADISVRDKAGNSARSLVIKNKDFKLADILLSDTSSNHERKCKNTKSPEKSVKLNDYFCELCNTHSRSKEHHLSSTIHNINLSKGKKIPTNYVIPESNRGYQIMLKVGWDKEAGLGPDGSGKMYPIKTVQKQDRKGLGHGKRLLKEDKGTEIVKHKNRKTIAKDHEFNKKMEINFRRQFY